MKYVQTILAAALIAGFTTVAMAADTDTTAEAPAAKPAVHKVVHHRHHHMAKMHHEAAPATAPVSATEHNDFWMGTPHSMNNHPTHD